jgi:hypothetical protein
MIYDPYALLFFNMLGYVSFSFPSLIIFNTHVYICSKKFLRDVLVCSRICICGLYTSIQSLQYLTVTYTSKLQAMHAFCFYMK